MVKILLIILVYCIAGYALWSYYLSDSFKRGSGALKSGKQNYTCITVIAIAAFAVRMILAAVYKGHESDMGCFTGWSESIFSGGIGSFYKSDSFHDYPPGYMYVLYIIGAVRKIIPLSGGPLYMLIKLPAVVCDILTGLVIYKIAEKRFSNGVSNALAIMYFVNPAAILNCSLWGQVDSVYTLFILLAVYMMSEKKMIWSYLLFAVCVLIKPQSLILTPLLIAAIIENVFLDDFSKEKLWKNLAFGVGAIIIMVLLMLPFGIKDVLGQYTETLGSYNHPTVNAFNFWGMLGKNWTDLKTIESITGYLFIIEIVAYSMYVFFKSKDKSKYYFVGALLVFLTYMFSTKMHERYAFPAMALLLAALVMTKNFHSYVMYIAVTLSQLLNAAWVLFVYQTDINTYYKSPSVIFASIVNLILTAYIVYAAYKLYVRDGLNNPAVSFGGLFGLGKNELPVKSSGKQGKKSKKNAANKEIASEEPAENKKINRKITRVDLIIMAVITLVYSGIALYDLGDNHAPETEYMVSDNAATIDLGSEYEISGIKYFLGSYELGDDRTLTVVMRDASNRSVKTNTFKEGSVFAWNEEDISAKARYITLSTTASDLSVKELAVLDKDGNVITPKSSQPEEAAALYDEQDEIPDRASFRNSTYFDEIYHARTGYEFNHGLTVYEWTHPPLGKVIIALGIKIFGMNPFGWRIMGTLFGIFMIPLIYLFAKKLLGKTFFAAVTCLLLTFDFMHFAQTRIATIDVYVTFFIMLMYYFMYRYYITGFDKDSYKKDFLMLMLCGISTGLGIASKWTGIYAAVFGLLPLWCIAFYRKCKQYSLQDKSVKNEVKNYPAKTILICVIFFIAVPAVIYLASYIPFLHEPGAEGIKTIFKNQTDMLTYHGKTVLSSTHPFSSKWYEWIVMARPIWYYSGKISDTVKEGISSFGNPLVWWVGIPAFIYMLYLCIAKKDKTALFLAISYLAQLLPWVFVERLTFIYHYFPCVPFVVLMIGYSIKTLYDKAKNKKKFCIMVGVYALLVIIMFAMFYPVLSGQPVSVDYVNNFLKWFDRWVLI